MWPKYISVLLLMIGFIALASSADAPCDSSPYAEGECPDQTGVWIFHSGACFVNTFIVDLEKGTSGYQCVKPSYGFNTDEECEEKCKDHLVSEEEYIKSEEEDKS